MKIEKIDYAKKLIKFDKVVEATKVLEKILSDSNDKILSRNIIELLLNDIEFKNHKTDSDRINYLIGLFKSNDGEEENIKKFEKKLEEKTIHKKEKLLDFNDEFSNLFLYFEKFFLTNNLEYNLNNKELKIVDFNIAKIIAHDQDIDEPFESWNDLRSSVSKKVYSIVYEEKINIDIFEKKIDQLNQILEKN